MSGWRPVEYYKKKERMTKITSIGIRYNGLQRTHKGRVLKNLWRKKYNKQIK